MTQWLVDPVNAVVRATDAELLEGLREVETAARRAYAVSIGLVAELEARGVAAHQGYRSTATLLSALLRVGVGDARQRVRHAQQAAPRRSLTGEVLAPLLPAAAEAVAEGAIGPGHLRVIDDTVSLIPDSVVAADRVQAESDLARHARQFDPAALATIGQRILAGLDPDGPAPDDAEPPRRELNLRRRRDGGLGVEGRFDAEAAAIITTALGSLTTPRPVDGAPDPRGAAERNGDALVELCEQRLAAGDLPNAGCAKPHVTVTLSLADLEARTREALLDYGVRLSPETARRMACDAEIIPIVLGAHSEPVDVGRLTATVPAGMRRALVARDRGCTFPGCGRPPAWCHAHHVRHWADGGPTALSNLVLLCTAHHRLIHHSGWDVEITDGHPLFHPPRWLDPTRSPVRNPLRC